MGKVSAVCLFVSLWVGLGMYVCLWWIHRGYYRRRLCLIKQNKTDQNQKSINKKLADRVEQWITIYLFKRWHPSFSLTNIQLLSKRIMEESYTRIGLCPAKFICRTVLLFLLHGVNSSPWKLDPTDAPDTRKFSGMCLNIDVLANKISVWSGNAAVVNNSV